MTEEEERDYRDSLEEKFSKGEIDLAGKAIINYEVNGSYYQIVWKKGLVLLDELDKLGFKIIKK